MTPSLEKLDDDTLTDFVGDDVKYALPPLNLTLPAQLAIIASTLF